MATIIALPPYALALFIVVILSLLAGTSAWVFLVHRRRFSLRIPTTQVEAQVQVQVQVEKIHDPTPVRSSSWLGLPFASSTTPSPSDTWIQRILRRHSKEAAGVVLPDAPTAEKHAPTTPPLDVSGQPPRQVKKELWLAFDSDATLATLQNDPLGERYCKAPSRGAAPTLTVPCTPPLIDDKSSPPSPVSFWEPLTPPLVPEDHTNTSISSLGSERPVKIASKKSEETDDAFSCPHSAPEEPRFFLRSASSSVCTLIHETLSLPPPGNISMDSDADLKVSCTRLAALIDAISVSFSASTLGPPFSRRNTKLGLGDCDYESDDSDSEGDDCDLPHYDDDIDDDCEWDLGTAKLHETPSQPRYSVLAI